MGNQAHFSEQSRSGAGGRCPWSCSLDGHFLPCPTLYSVPSCLCSEKSLSALFPSLLRCMPLWAPPHTWHPSDDLHGTCCNLKRTYLWPLSRRAGPWLVSHYCISWATNGLSTRQAVHTLCEMDASMSEDPTKDEPLHFSLLIVAPQPEPSL